jgi:hypothetical protein
MKKEEKIVASKFEKLSSNLFENSLTISEMNKVKGGTGFDTFTCEEKGGGQWDGCDEMQAF